MHMKLVGISYNDLRFEVIVFVNLNVPNVSPLIYNSAYARHVRARRQDNYTRHANNHMPFTKCIVRISATRRFWQTNVRP